MEPYSDGLGEPLELNDCLVLFHSQRQARGNLNLSLLILGCETRWTKIKVLTVLFLEKCQSKIEVRKKSQKNASNVTFLHHLGLWGELEASLLRKEKPLLLTTFCQDNMPARAMRFLQSSCSGKAASFPMILMGFDWCLWDSLKSVKLSRVGQTRLGQKCQASVNHHVQSQFQLKV